VVFMGTPRFAVPVLERLLEVHEVLAVYTRPDAVSRRGSSLVPPPVKECAASHGVRVVQPERVSDPQVVSQMRALEADVICVAAYGAILPRDLLAVPRFGCVNVHASLLPRYRGAAPVQRAILTGETVTGVTIMRMEEGLDTGPYALQVRVEMDELYAEELTQRLSLAGADALLTVLERIEAGTVTWRPQDESKATYAPKVTRADVALDPRDTVTVALRKVRASTPSASVAVVVGDMSVVVLRASTVAFALEPGMATLTSSGIALGMADGVLLIDQLRPAGRNAMSGDAFARGRRIQGVVPWRRG
ncbi:MAG: methionyl-tRNA formyltransferase, partial [Coriobacteriales bacterium]